MDHSPQRGKGRRHELPVDLGHLPAALTVPECAALLRVGTGAIYSAVKEGAIPAVRINGRAIRIPRRAVLELLGEPQPRGELHP